MMYVFASIAFTVVGCVFGAACKTLRNMYLWDQWDMEYIEKAPDKISVITSNVYLIIKCNPWNNKRQVERLIEYLKNNKPDVLILQEVWYQRYLSNILKVVNYPTIISGNTVPNMAGSGQVVLSKYKVDDINFQDFQVNFWPDNMVKKGLLSFRIGSKTFVSTHLPNDNLYHNRSTAVNDLLEFMATNKPDVVLGDFNFTPDSSHYHAVINSGYTDAFPLHPITVQNKTVDFVFTRCPVKNTELLPFKEMGISDHNGLRFEVSGTNKEESHTSSYQQ
jgi:endonuclease/exonuclease/phosphatase family metal-dependent hydrolase